ncbi:MAG: hypothetical protein QOG85_400 [Gaiellaceae bacterium]|jgi:outer membrane protein assembly factor BamB|nr:hypothetical protein [Gaiellaceae bacterium]
MSRGNQVVSRVVKRSLVFVAMFAALVLVGPAIPSNPGVAADQATAYQMDATHDGSIADAGLAAPLAQAWSITLPGNASYPLIVNGTVFVTSSGTLYAIDQATGSTIWSRPVGPSVGLTYDRGRVFVGTGGGGLTAYDAATGAVVWGQQLPGQWAFSSEPTAANGIVYTGGAGSGGTVYAARESDGHLLWFGSVMNGDSSSPAVTPQGVYVSYACQQAYAFNPLSGSLLWHHSTGCEGGGGATTVVADGAVFVRDGGGNVMLSAADGSTLGPFNAGPPPAVANGVAYMVSGASPNAQLTAISGSGLGTNNWSFTSDGSVNTPPVVANGLVFVGSASHTVYALDATTGATSWSTNVGAAPKSLAAANGTLIVSAGSKLIAFRNSGTISSAPSNSSSPSIAGSGTVGDVEAADVGIWSGLPSSYTYQWEHCNAAGLSCTDITGATGPTLVPPGAYVGSTLRVRITATNGVDSSAPLESPATATLGGSAGTHIPTSPTAAVYDGATSQSWTGNEPVGATAFAKATVTGQGIVPTGSVTYNLFANGTCSGAAASSQQVPLNADGSVADSNVSSPLMVGSYSFNAAYSGDSAYASSVSACQPFSLGSPADQATAYQLDATHDGHIADAGLAAPLAQAWSITLPGSASYPLIVNGRVFVTASDGNLYAINQATGSTIWSHATGGGSGLTYDRGRIFVLSSGGLLTAFNAATGSLAWSTQVGTDPFQSPPTAANGIVFVGVSNNLEAVAESNGTVLWTKSVAGGMNSSPAVTKQGVYASYACQQAYAFTPTAGTLLWHHNSVCSGGGGNTVAVADGIVFVRDTYGGLGNDMFSAADGSTLGTFSAGPGDLMPAIGDHVAYILSGSAPNVKLTAIAADGLGTSNWTFSSDGNIKTSPMVANGLVFVGSSNGSATDGHVYALDAATGATSWSTALGVPPTALAAANGTLVVSAGTKLIAYRTAGTISNAPSSQSPPTITGSGNSGEIEAADVGIWSGLPSSYTYQWELCDAAGANCSDIAGATGPTFVPPDADLGSTLRFRVVATNGIGSSTPVESIPVGLGIPTAPPAISASPVVSGTATVGQQLSTTNGTWMNSPTSYQYKWQRCDNAGSNCVDIASATSPQYTLVGADAGYRIRSEVRASNAIGPALAYAPSAPTNAVAPIDPPELSSAPVVSGATTTGWQLSTTNGTWTNAPTSYQYVWQRCDNAGSNCVDIANATSSQYTLTDDDVGFEVRSEVLASNSVGPAAAGYAPSTPTSVVTDVPTPALSASPVVSGTTTVGQQLSTTNGSWTNAPTSYQYKWQRCDSAGSNCVDIPNATSWQYLLVNADWGHEIRSEVRASNASGPAPGYAPSAPTSVVAHKPVVVTLPLISGIAKVGVSLSVSNGTWKWAPTQYAYQWFRCNAYAMSCKKIVGATSSSYLLTGADVGHKLKAKVTASNVAGAVTATSSNASGKVKS